MRVLIIGLDGGTWDVMDDYLLENHMPNLNRLKREGYSGILKSTNPWITPPAWTTCITGCNPAKHGIAGFQRYCFEEDSLEITTSSDCLVPNMWQELSRQGYKVASINVPWTYPCQEINGIIVAGYGCPGVQADFTYPAGFKKRLLERIRDYDIRGDWEDWKPGNSFEKFDENVARVERSYEQKLEAAQLVSEEVDWDVLMVELQDIDMMEHRLWTYLSKYTRDQHAAERDRLFRSFAKLDEVIGRLLGLASDEEQMVVTVSDHGFGDRLGDIKPNTLLYRWGYLKFRSPISRRVNKEIRHLRHKLSSFLLLAKDRSMYFDTNRLGRLVDLKRSKAVVMHMSVNGYLYVNLRGRQRGGIVEPGAEYENLIEDLRRRFESAVSPHTGERLFAAVATPAELYKTHVVDPERFGDLILVSEPKYRISLLGNKHDYVKRAHKHATEGHHHPDGIFSFSGTNIKRASNKVADISDIAPTVYAALGAKLPTYMDGMVLTEAFSREPDPEFQRQQERIEIRPSGKLSKKDQQAIAERLAQLGYLD
jgi:predicted AlkP superfamily phosphohydrolase/phosphomutase